jgi:hypothetical protein
MFLTVYFASGSLCVEGMVVSIDEMVEVIVDAGSDNTGEVWRDSGRLVGLRYDSPGFCWVVGFVFGGFLQGFFSFFLRWWLWGRFLWVGGSGFGFLPVPRRASITHAHSARLRAKIKKKKFFLHWDTTGTVGCTRRNEWCRISVLQL